MRQIWKINYFLFLTYPCLTYAEDNASITNTGQIIVTGQGLKLPPGNPAYGSIVLDRAHLINSASNRIEGVLNEIAGFQQFRRSDSRSANPSAQGATLRALGGNASSRTLVLFDGIPMGDPFFGYIPFSALTPNSLSSIRITRGSGVGAFGPGAVAGTIELASATRAELPTLAASAFYGSRNATELSAALSPNVGNGYISLAGRWDRGDGFETTPKDQRVVATRPASYNSWSTSLRAVAPLSANAEIQFRGALFHDTRTLRFSGADSLSEGQDASIRLISRGPWQIDTLVYLQARNFKNIVISSTSFRKSLDQRNTPSTGIGGKIEVRPPVGSAHMLRIGVDTRFASGEMLEDAYDANLANNPITYLRRAGGQQLTTGLFAENDWTIGKLILTGGVRADRWEISDGTYRQVNAAPGTTINKIFDDRSDWEFSGRAGALLRLNDHVSLRGSGYTGFRLPTLNELYRPFVVFPITTQANENLRPETLKGVEAGIELTALPHSQLSFTGFINNLDNAITNVTTGKNLRQRQNIRRIAARGFELSASTQISSFRVSGSYAYSHSVMRAPNMEFNGLSPAQSPRHSASGTIAWEPKQGPTFSATARYVSKQFEDDLQADILPKALTIDGIARFPISPKMTLIARGENLFNKAVVTRNSGGSIDLGTPRTIWIGISLPNGQ